MATELTLSSATSLAKSIAARSLSSEEVVRAFLERIEAVNTELNAVVQLASERALAEARAADAALARGQSLAHSTVCR